MKILDSRILKYIISVKPFFNLIGTHIAANTPVEEIEKWFFENVGEDGILFSNPKNS